MNEERPDGEVPWFKSKEDLSQYIEQMLQWPEGSTDDGEGYGRCVYAMANAALAAFRYVAGRLGVTGFQASMADLEFITQTRHLNDGFIILDARELLYPQYQWLLPKHMEWISDLLPRLGKRAKELLAEQNGGHPEVRAHWEYLAKFAADDAKAIINVPLGGVNTDNVERP